VCNICNIECVTPQVWDHILLGKHSPFCTIAAVCNNSIRFLCVTPQVWDHILLGKPAPSECAIAPELLARMRAEFEFWYPFDLRVSGKVRGAPSWDVLTQPHHFLMLTQPPHFLMPTQPPHFLMQPVTC
jgi:hypothetical protein